jgi:NAD(P)-dependent dehydrogenase (short-subunit alcohol dehydrogenase family)
VNEITCVITGASAGIGAAAALDLARRGARVVLVGRDPGKLAAVAARISAETGTESEVHPADFSRLDEVRALAGTLRDRYDRIDVLASNAGGLIRKRQLTVDGYETTIQVNHLAPFLLTTLLWDRLAAAPDARVVTTSSAVASLGRLDPLNLDRLGKPYSKWIAYCNSKQANVLFTTELARRAAGTSISATCFHPGPVRSDFGRDWLPFRIFTRLPLATRSPEQAARTLVHLALEEDGGTHSGGYFTGGRAARLPRNCADPALAAALWEASAAAVGV